MQDIRWKSSWLLLLALLTSLVIWALTDSTTALLSLLLFVFSYLCGHLFWIHKLTIWLKSPDISTIPVGIGIWEDIFAALYHEQRRKGRSLAQVSAALDRFKHASSAIPDGVVLLNGINHIEWCNPAAEQQLGLSGKHDNGQPIVYLVRHIDFIDYLNKDDYKEPIKLKSWRNPELTLEIQLVKFGSNQKLLISRNVTQLEKLEHMRRDFIANVSHELRTPLTVVGGFLETLNDIEGAVPESTRSYFSMMQEQTNRMRFLIEDLLTLSQLESGTLAPTETEIDIQSLLNMILNESQSLSNGKHTISLIANPEIMIKGAQQELHSAFGNLVSNAIRYTPENGEIKMKWELKNNEGIFSVQDNGIGIEKKHIARISERFYRVDKSRSRETGGTGLGLSIVKHILSRHHAKLEIVSEYGKGSTFSAVFPFEKLVIKNHE